MKIPLIWLKDYIDITKSPEEIAESFTALGLMLERPIENDILDLEHRFDRSDWLSVTGCARDLAAMEGLKLELPDVIKQQAKEGGGVKIKIECPEVVRFNTRVFRNIKVGKSPDWLQKRLEAYGMPSVNNIVDITNFVMVEYGQPMHAQDLAKFEKQEIVIRHAKEDEEITTLLGDVVKLEPETFILTQNDKPIAIGGIVGGQLTGVSEETTDIVLDAGNYDNSSIRRSSRKLKIQNETVLRYDKFLHPKLTEVALNRATNLILELAGGEYYENHDYYPKEVPEKEMDLRQSRVELLSGMEFEWEDIKKMLIDLGYEVLGQDGFNLKLKVPYFRTDVLVEDDIVSDIVRVNNFEKIPLEQIKAAPPKDATPPIYNFEDKIRAALVNLGLHEHITNPLVKLDPDKKSQVHLENALSSEQNALRTTMYETLTPVLDIYKKHKIDDVRIFDIGLVYEKEGSGDTLEDYKETRTLGVVFNVVPPLNIANRHVKAALSGLFRELGITDVSYKDTTKNSEKSAAVYQNNLLLGELRVDSFSLFTERLLDAKKTSTRVAFMISNKITEDITIDLKTTDQTWPIIEKIKSADENVDEVEVLDEFAKDAETKKVTFRVTFSNPDGENLTTNQVKKIKEEKILKGLD